MDSQEILMLIDAMDLSDDFLNQLLEKIMTSKTLTTKNMENALRLLKYQLAVNKQEGTSCSNKREYEFVVRLIRDVNPDTVKLVCEITYIVLQLDPSSIVSKAEHLLQQILSEIELPTFKIVPESCDDDIPQALIDLKLCSAILEAVINQNKKVSLPFLQVPLENMVFSPNDKILNFFYTSTIHNFKVGVTGFSILDRLWACLKTTREFKEVTLKTVSCLGDYFLPVPEGTEKQRNAFSIAADSEFWETALFGLQSSDNAVRKRAIYLIKRALETLTGSKNSININTEEMVMVWDQKNEKMLKAMWDNFFILIDSLEEMQSNIVLPSLKLFESVKHLGHCWLSCAYSIGLKHDNSSVRLHCILYRLEIKIESKSEAIALLDALNDINLYENPLDSRELTKNISKALEDKQSLMNILEAIPSVKWSPVPLYYLSETIGEVIYPTLLLNVEHSKVCSMINDILRIPCNSPVIKKAIYAHISNFIVNSCKGFTWEDYVSVYPNLHLETPITSFIMTSLATHIKKNLYLSDADKKDFSHAMATACENVNVGLLYVSAHEQDGISYFLSIIDEKVDRITNICNTPFSNKSESLDDVNFLINVYSTTAGRSEPYMVFINGAVMKHSRVILECLYNLLTTTIPLDVDGIVSFYDTLSAMPINDKSTKDFLLQLYKSSVLLLRDTSAPLDKIVSAISVMNYLLQSHIMTQYHQAEILTLEQFLVRVKDIEKNMHGCGKLKNVFYEKSCEVVLSYLKEEPSATDAIEIFGFIEDVLECGGYGCLKFILRVTNKILPTLINNEVTFDFSLFLNQMWIHICELKTNKEYIVCVDDFVRLITQDELLRHPQHNSVVVGHYITIIDLAVTKRMPLYFLVKHLSGRNVMVYDNMANVLCDILLYAIVPKKDQRITENLTVELLPKMQGIMMADMHIFSQHIQFLSVAMLSKVTGVSDLDEISQRIMTEIDQILRIKPRYYANSTTHRKLIRAMQTLLFIFLKTRQVDVKKTATWCMNLLRMPHDVSDIVMDSELLEYLTENGVPLISQFTIVYFVMRHKIPARMHFSSETEFVLDFLLANTMGPVFSVRLLAQYYAMMLFETGTIRKKIDIHKYSSMISILSKTLGDLVASKDNSFNNLRNDYFTQTFDIVGDLTLMFIYHSMRRRCEQSTENIDSHFALKIFSQIEEALSTEDHDAFYVEWKGTHRWHAVSHYQGLPSAIHMEVQEEASTIQKKYIPWKNMTDVEMDSFRRNLKNVIDLIVVASLVSRTPNLGGLARTCEVFGVMSYVIDNLHNVQDKQFQSLSVSADRWVNIEEVHTGRALKEYLLRKKKEGYCIVAAEQTSSSRDLTEFRFPRKSLIMLGHEKEGIPPNLLPLMDFCVEIPQQGVIRSLNVHVTASIFIWEYTRQLATRSGAPFFK